MIDKLSLADVDPILDEYVPRKLSWFEEILTTLEYYKDNVVYFFHNIKDGIQNLVYYFPVIWKDRCWDFEYFFLELLKYKLINTRDGLIKENIIADIDNVKDEINALLNFISEYKDSDEIFREENQDLLHKIQDTQNKELKSKMVRDYCIKCQMYEIGSRNKIFDFLKENCGKWWS